MSPYKLSNFALVRGAGASPETFVRGARASPETFPGGINTIFIFFCVILLNMQVTCVATIISRGINALFAPLANAHAVVQYSTHSGVESSKTTQLDTGFLGSWFYTQKKAAQYLLLCTNDTTFGSVLELLFGSIPIWCRIFQNSLLRTIMRETNGDCSESCATSGVVERYRGLLASSRFKFKLLCRRSQLRCRRPQRHERVTADSRGVISQ